MTRIPLVDVWENYTDKEHLEPQKQFPSTEQNTDPDSLSYLKLLMKNAVIKVSPWLGAGQLIEIWFGLPEILINN